MKDLCAVHASRLHLTSKLTKEGKTMKIQYVLCAALAAACFAGCESEEHDSAKQARLVAQSKISEADARSTALTRAPNGTIKESELEKEHGKLIWSFDIATPDSKEITEVNVDAIDGSIVSVEKEKEKD
jgi:uncharacterized membrane protein YkoI